MSDEALDDEVYGKILKFDKGWKAARTRQPDTSGGPYSYTLETDNESIAGFLRELWYALEDAKEFTDCPGHQLMMIVGAVNRTAAIYGNWMFNRAIELGDTNHE